MARPTHPHLAALWEAVAREDAWRARELAAARRLSFADQVAVGVAWPVLNVEDESPAGRGRVAWTLRAPRGVRLHEGIGPGDRVDVLPAGGAGVGLDGRVLGVEDEVAVVRVPDAGPAPERIAVALRHDPDTARRQQEALAWVTPGPLAVALLTRPPTAWDETPPGAWPGLDEAQARAAAAALAADALALIEGPPGTGKTRVIVALLRALVASGDRPWALADSNAAADHLAVRAAADGLDVVRVGHLARMSAPAAALSLEARVRAHAVWPAVRTVDKELSRLRSHRSPGGRAEVRALTAERDRLLDQARAEVLAGAQVIAMTLGTLAARAGGLPAPHTAIVDEATQAVEPAVWAAVPWVRRLVLVGDPQQLGPVVLEPGNPLGRGLLQRLVEEGFPAPRLEVQHRMHADIAATVAGVYGPGWRAHPSVASHRLTALPGVSAPDPIGAPLRFVDTAGAGLEEARDPRTGSWFNAGEVSVVAQAVAAWRAAGVAADDIGVIAPYSAQVARLRARPELAGIEVATVNAFQGREKEAIAVSLVRSNATCEVGFVADRRRLTVALTRARRAWLGVGDSATLGAVPGVAAMLDAVAAAGGLESVWSWELDP